MSSHRLLERQLREFLGADAEVPETWQRLLDAVSKTYEQFDSDRPLAESATLLTAEEIEADKKTADAAAQALERTNEALQASEAFLRSLVETLPINIYRKDTAGRLTFANKHYCEWRGKPLAELLGKTDFDLSPPEFAQKYWADNLAVMESQHSIDKVEMQVNPCTGRPNWIRIIKVPVIDPSGRVVGTQGSYWDVTERKQAEEALRQSEQRFREMAESIRDVFWITSADARQFLYVSPAYEPVWGRTVEELYRQPTAWVEAIVPEDRERVLAAQTRLADGNEYRIEYRIARPNGAIRWVEDRGYPVHDANGGIHHALGVVTDITERRHLEETLRQAQKMEAIGQLASGVAHDFNNLLVVIMGYARLMLDVETLDPENVRESLKQIYSAGERAASLTRQLLVFGRKHHPQLQVLDLNDVIDDIGTMLRRLIGEDITIQLTLSPRRPFVRADAGMVEQILMNLAVNARDAMPRGGRVVIKTEPIFFSEDEAKQQPAAREGDFICLSVADTGMGIAPEILPRIFEPFFTTKEPGKGTGLGLATVFGIVRQHEGWLTVESQVNVGTTFNVFLPSASRDGAVAAISGTAVKVDGGQEMLLVVEDEGTVRDFTVAVLQRYGYRVLQADSGVKALEVWQLNRERIAVLITDLVMPGNITGLELAERLQTEKPALKVICTSGYSGDVMEKALRPRLGVQFIHKPYPPRTIAKAVRDMLDAKP